MRKSMRPDECKSERAESKTFRLSKRLSVEITVGPGGCACEWDPDVPTHLTAKELRRYRQARDEMVQRLAQMLGCGSALIVEAGGGRGINSFHPQDK